MLGRFLVFFFLILSTNGWGQVITVSKISFEGNKTFSTKTLKKLMRTKKGKPYDEFQADMDRRRLRTFYKSQGFPEVKVRYKSLLNPDNQLDYTLIIKEGKRVRIMEIRFSGNTIFSGEELGKCIGIKTGDPLIEQNILLSKYSILNKYAERGHIYANVKSKVENIAYEDFALEFNVEEGDEVRIGKIQIKGNKKVRRQIIEREINLVEGTVYDPEKIYKSQVQIYSTGLFKSCKFEAEGVSEKRDTVDITFSVVERKPMWTRFGIGYQYPAPGELALKSGWGHDNLFNNGQKINITGKYNTTFQRKHIEGIDFKWLEPYLLGSHFQGEFHVYQERETEDSHRTILTGINMKIGRYIGTSGQGFIQYKYEIWSGTAPREIANSILFPLSYDSRDDIFYPTRGLCSSISYQYTGGWLGGNINFQRILYDVAKFKKIYKFIIARRLKLGYIWREKNMPLRERFTLGGIGSLRGYEKESIGPLLSGPYEEKHCGNILSLANLEIRMPIILNLELTYFIDAGYAWMDLHNVSIDDVKVDAGLGLGYRSPVGPLQISYGHPLSGERKGGNIYFNIGYMF